MDSAVSISYETRLRPEHMISTDWIDAQWSKIIGGCDALQSNWMPHAERPFDHGTYQRGLRPWLS